MGELSGIQRGSAMEAVWCATTHWNSFPSGADGGSSAVDTFGERAGSRTRPRHTALGVSLVVLHPLRSRRRIRPRLWIGASALAGTWTC